MEQTDDALVIIVFGTIFVVLFFFPTFIAFWRGHPNRWLIFLINAVFGATVIGWFGTLIWSLKALHLSGSNQGGQSGLNIFEGDVKKNMFEEKVSQHAISDELEKLHGLLRSEAINQSEYEALKSRLIK